MWQAAILAQSFMAISLNSTLVYDIYNVGVKSCWNMWMCPLLIHSTGTVAYGDRNW